ncbi:MAG: hypothetical protein OES09_07325 [Gammaproteobacteria bacterium]|nr:hypothetical protein [Gammaproteobacteria bacterium]
MLKISRIILVVILAGAGSALADHERLTLDQAAKNVERETNSRVLDARTCDVAGRLEHCFKVLTPDGRVRKIYVDPERQLRSQRRHNADSRSDRNRRNGDSQRRNKRKRR